jgi:iron complex transport system substrate-binding protein
VIDAFIKIHCELEPRTLESVYETVLARDPARRGLVVERQKAVAFDYDGMHFEEGLQIDLLVNGCVVIELKSVEKLSPVHGKKLLTYLRLMRLPDGLLLNFGSTTLKEGLQRVVNNISPSASQLEPSMKTRRPATHAQKVL